MLVSVVPARFACQLGTLGHHHVWANQSETREGPNGGGVRAALSTPDKPVLAGGNSAIELLIENTYSIDGCSLALSVRGTDFAAISELSFAGESGDEISLDDS